MFKWSKTLTSLVLVISAGTSANATLEAEKDPRGLLRVSSSLLLAGDGEVGGRSLQAQGDGILVEVDDPNKPSNTNAARVEESGPLKAAAVVLANAQKKAVAAEALAQSVARGLTDAQEREARKYVFGDEERTEGKLQPRLLAAPLISLLQALKGGAAKTTDEMEPIVEVAGTPVKKLVYRYKDRNFLTQDVGSDRFKITPLGLRVLELLEANYKPGSDPQKKRSRREDEEGEDDVAEDDENDYDDSSSSVEEVAKPAAPKKTKISGPILSRQMKKPEMHHAILATLEDDEASLGEIRIRLKKTYQEIKHLDTHLKTQIGYGWVTRELIEDDYVYSMTDKGALALAELAKLAGDDEDDEEEVVQKKAAVPQTQKKATAPQKRQRGEEADDSDELISPQMKKPELHYGMLSALGNIGTYLDAESLFGNMGRHRPGEWAKRKDNFIHYYLATHVKKGWMKEVNHDGEKEYTITDKGVRVRAKLLELVQDAKKDEQEDESSSSSSSSEPVKKKAAPAKPKTAPAPAKMAKRAQAEEEEEDESSSSSSSSEPVKKKAAPAKPKTAPAPTPAPARAKVATAPAPTKSASPRKTDLAHKSVPAKPTPAKQPIEVPDHQPQDDRANEWVEGDGKAGAITLDQLPEQLQRHLMGQVEDQFAAMMTDAEFIRMLRRTVFKGLHDRLAEEFFRLFATQPGNALRHFLSDNVTVTITRNEK
jgi:DNA-binding PadR family transcriptional regulator